MPRTTAQAFDYFRDNQLLPTTAQRADVTYKRTKTEEYLKSAFPNTSSMPLKRLVLIGSCDRGTHIQPVSDVDVLAVFLNKDNIFEAYRSGSGAFLQRIRAALGASTTIKHIGARGQAVRLFYTSGAHVDIAPVFGWSGGGYALPSGSDGWITTDPEAQAKWLAQRKTDVGDNLSCLIRFAKRWNEVHSSRLESYHLEVVIATMFSSVGVNTREALRMFFERGMGWLSVSDPAGHSGDLSTYLTDASRAALRSRMAQAAARAASAVDAESRGDHEEAKRLWRIELGNGFPVS